MNRDAYPVQAPRVVDADKAGREAVQGNGIRWTNAQLARLESTELTGLPGKHALFYGTPSPRSAVRRHMRRLGGAQHAHG
jgi:hypothetical protein